MTWKPFFSDKTLLVYEKTSDDNKMCFNDLVLQKKNSQGMLASMRLNQNSQGAGYQNLLQEIGDLPNVSKYKNEIRININDHHNLSLFLKTIHKYAPFNDQLQSDLEQFTGIKIFAANTKQQTTTFLKKMLGMLSGNKHDAIQMLPLDDEDEVRDLQNATTTSTQAEKPNTTLEDVSPKTSPRLG